MPRQIAQQTPWMLHQMCQTMSWQTPDSCRNRHSKRCPGRCLTDVSTETLTDARLTPNRGPDRQTASLSPIFTIFSVLVNNDIVHIILAKLDQNDPFLSLILTPNPRWRWRSPSHNFEIFIHLFNIIIICIIYILVTTYYWQEHVCCWFLDS